MTLQACHTLDRSVTVAAGAGADELRGMRAEEGTKPPATLGGAALGGRP